jgi:hypothetical protein
VENETYGQPEKIIHHPHTPANNQPAGGNGSGNNGGNGGNGTGNGDSTGRLSQKQHSFLLHLADDRGVSRKDLDDMSKERFSCVVSYLSKNDASSLIREMTTH